MGVRSARVWTAATCTWSTRQNMHVVNMFVEGTCSSAGGSSSSGPARCCAPASSLEEAMVKSASRCVVLPTFRLATLPGQATQPTA